MVDGKKVKFLVINDDSAGFESTIVSNPHNTLKAIAEDSQNLERVILDSNIQIFPGDRMFDGIKRLAPELPIFITSG
tara:strand:- start:111 stop:341 length:231 start_codon:yes stop_codon:yes gene_type:complete